MTYGEALVAPFWRHKGRFGSKCVRRRCCGAVLAPQGSFPQRPRTKPSLWRLPGATRAVLAASTYETPAAAPFFFGGCVFNCGKIAPATTVRTRTATISVSRVISCTSWLNVALRLSLTPRVPSSSPRERAAGTLVQRRRGASRLPPAWVGRPSCASAGRIA